MTGPTAMEIAAELERASRDALRSNLDLLAEAGNVHNATDLAAFAARVVDLATKAALADAALLTRVAARAIDKSHETTAADELTNRAIRSPIAHAGEPPDYAADNE